jgi:hypothetical protein
MIAIAIEIVIMECNKIEILKKQKLFFDYVLIYNNIKYMIYIITFYQEKNIFWIYTLYAGDSGRGPKIHNKNHHISNQSLGRFFA